MLPQPAPCPSSQGSVSLFSMPEQLSVQQPPKQQNVCGKTELALEWFSMSCAHLPHGQKALKTELRSNDEIMLQAHLWNGQALVVYAFNGCLGESPIYRRGTQEQVAVGCNDTLFQRPCNHCPYSWHPKCLINDELYRLGCLLRPASTINEIKRKSNWACSDSGQAHSHDSLC